MTEAIFKIIIQPGSKRLPDRLVLNKKYMKTILGIFFCCLFFKSNAQVNSKFNLQIDYGLNGNFFVRSYDEIGGPVNKTYLYKKNFLGSIAGAEISYRLKKKSAISFAYRRSVNSGKKNYEGSISNTDIHIRDFKLRHINNIYQLGYGHYLGNTGKFKVDLGFVFFYYAQQNINIENWANYVSIDESNFKNSNSGEGGVFASFQYFKKIDTRFDIGLRVQGYYLISVTTFEAISITPTLTYHF